MRGSPVSDLGLAQKVVTARATIPFTFCAEGHEFQAGDYVSDNEVPVQLRSIVKEQTQLTGSQSFSTPFRQSRKNPKLYSCFETESTFYLNSGAFRLASGYVRVRASLRGEPATAPIAFGDC
jgi:hypothetical protein